MATKTKTKTKQANVKQLPPHTITKPATTVDPATLLSKTATKDLELTKGSMRVLPLGKTAPKVVLSSLAYEKQKALVNACTVEVGWLGFVDIEEDGTLLVTDILVPKQEVTGVTTEIDETALGDMGMQLALTKEGCDMLSKMYYWGHSHVDMAVNPSGTDDKTMRDLGANCPIFIRGIFNKSGDANIAIADYQRGVAYVDAPVSVRGNHQFDVWAASMVTDNLTMHKTQTTYANGYGGKYANGYGGKYANGYGNYANGYGVSQKLLYEEYDGWWKADKGEKKRAEEPAEGSDESVAEDIYMAIELSLADVASQWLTLDDLIEFTLVNVTYQLAYTEVYTYITDNWSALVDLAGKTYGVVLVVNEEDKR